MALAAPSIVFSAEEIEYACSGNYKDCGIQIILRVEVSSAGLLNNIFVGYTDHPI